MGFWDPDDTATPQECGGFSEYSYSIFGREARRIEVNSTPKSGTAIEKISPELDQLTRSIDLFDNMRKSLVKKAMGELYTHGQMVDELAGRVSALKQKLAQEHDRAEQNKGWAERAEVRITDLKERNAKLALTLSQTEQELTLAMESIGHLSGMLQEIEGLVFSSTCDRALDSSNDLPDYGTYLAELVQEIRTILNGPPAPPATGAERE